MTRAELGTKRVCPETGKKFYDLDKDPIVSPYTGKEYPRSFFEETPAKPEKAAPAPKAEKEKPEETEATEDSEEDTPEFVSLEDADEGADDDDDSDDDEEAIAALPDVEIDDDDESDDDTFLEEEEEDDDLSDVIGDGAEGDEET